MKTLLTLLFLLFTTTYAFADNTIDDIRASTKEITQDVKLLIKHIHYLEHNPFLHNKDVRLIQEMMSRHTTTDGILLPSFEIDGKLGPITALLIKINLQNALYNAECLGE